MQVILCILAGLLSANLVAGTKTAKLRMLGGEGYLPKEIADKFIALVKQKYATDLTIEFKAMSDPMEFFEAIRGHQTDMITPAHNIPKSERFSLISQGLLIPVNYANIPNLEHVLPELRRPEYLKHNNEFYGVPYTFGPLALIYDRKEFAQAPTSWKVLWEERFRKRFAVSTDYHEANVYVAALAMGMKPQDLGDIEKIVALPDIRKRLSVMASSAKRLWSGLDKAADFEDCVLGTGWGFAIPELKARGKDWAIASPSEGTTYWVDNWSLTRELEDKPELKRIAEELLNLLVGPEGQLAVVRNLGSFPVNPTIVGSLSADEVKHFHLDDPGFFKREVIMWPILDRRTTQGFRTLWDNAKAEAGVK